MDFVMSKLGLSICALLMVSVLGGILIEPLAVTEHGELEAVAERFDDLISTLLRGGGETSHTFQVPSLSTGSGVSMTVSAGMVAVSSDRTHCAISPSYRIHLWQWNGSDMNLSAVAELDGACDSVFAVSGDQLLIEVRMIPVQGVVTTMAFVGLQEVSKS